MTEWIVETLAATSVLMALVLALRLPVARLFGARTAYALWLLPLVRMVLPPLPGWHTLFAPRMVLELPQPHGDGRLELSLADPTLPGPQFELPGVAPASGPAPWRLTFEHGMLALWLLGAALLLGWQLWRYRRFLAGALAGATPIGHAAGTELLLSDAVPGPLAAGVFRRRILLPRDFSTRYDRTSQRLVLDHEAAHHDRLDLPANLLALAMLALHWWNPIAWFAHRAFRADQELACDASVLARTDPAERYAYAEAVARTGGVRMPMAVAPLAPAAELKRRLRMMGRRGGGRVRGLLGGLIAAGVVGTGVLASASGAARTIVEGEMPLPPVAPASPLLPVHPATPPPPAPPPVIVAGSSHHRRILIVTPPDAPRPPLPSVPPLSPLPAAELAAGDAAIRADVARIAAEQAARATELAARATEAADVQRLVAASLAQAQAATAGACGGAGGCRGVAARSDVAHALRDARDALASRRTLSDAVRAQVTAELDAQLGQVESDPR